MANVKCEAFPTSPLMEGSADGIEK